MDMEELDHLDEVTFVENITALLEAVAADEDGLIIDRDGKPLVALIPAELYDELASDRDNRLWQISKAHWRSQEPEKVRPVSRVVNSIRPNETTLP
jgi:prevent-host-death family protein